MRKILRIIIMLIFVTEANAQTNIYENYNGDFELGRIANWRAVEVASGVALSIENEATASAVTISADANNGLNAVQFVWGIGTNIADIVFDLNMPVLPATTYVYRASAKSLSGACLLRIHATFYNSSGAIVGDYNDMTWQLGSSYAQHEWIIPVSPTGSSYAVIGFRAFNTDGSRWPATAVTTVIDDVQLWENYVEVNLATSATGTGTGSITLDPASVDGTYPDGTQVTITVSPDVDSEFVSWSGDVSGTANPLVITMDGDKSIIATINEALTPVNTISTLNGDFELGTITNWRAEEVVGSNVLSIENENTTSAIAVTNDANNGAYAAQMIWGVDSGINDIVFDLNISALPNTEYLFKANAKSLSGVCMLRIHCTFYDASGGVLGDYNDMSWILGSAYAEHQWALPLSPAGTTSAVIGFRVFNADGSRWPAAAMTTMIDDVQLWKNHNEVNLTTSITGTGSLTIEPASQNGVYLEGTQVILTALPNGNDVFDSWGGDAAGTANPLTLTLDSNMSIVATINEIVVASNNNILGAVNGYFELGSIANWRAVEVAGGTVLSVEYDNTESVVSMTSDTNTGNYAAQFTWGVDASIQDILFDQNIAVLAGTNYAYKASAKSLSGPGLLRIHCTFYDNGNAIVGDYNDVSWQLGATYTTHEWSIPAAPLGSSYAVIGFRVYNTDGSRWPASAVTTVIDDVQMWENTVGVEYTLSTNLLGTGNGSISLSPSGGYYAEGTQVIVTATPYYGSVFDAWGGDATGSSNAVVMTMDGNKTVSATLTDQTSSMVEMTANANSGNHAVQFTWKADANIDDVKFELSPPVVPDRNYTFSASALSLSGACILRMHCTFFDINDVAIGDYNDASWQLTDVFQQHDWAIPITPIGSSYAVIGFRVYHTDGSRWPASDIITIIDDVKLLDDFVQTYDLTTSMTGTGTGSLILEPAGGIYNAGTQVTITVVPDSDSEFSSWSGDASGANNPLIVTMDGDKNIATSITQVYNETNIFSGWNGDFELGTIQNWRALEVAGGSVLSVENDATVSSVTMSNDSNNGTFASQFTWGVDPSIADIVFDLNVGVLPDMDYTFKATAKSLSGAAILRIHCTYYDSNNAIVGDYNDATWQLTNTYQEHTWIMPKSPIGSSFAVVGFRAFNTDGSRWPATNITTVIDDVQLWERVPVSAGARVSSNLANVADEITNESGNLKVFPNPMASSTTLNYNLGEESHVKLAVYNIQGREVDVLVNTSQLIGDYKLNWIGNNLPNGMYIIRLELSNQQSQNIKIILNR